MQTLTTDLLPSDAEARRRLAHDEPALKAVFEALSTGLSREWVVVARWVRALADVDRHLVVRDHVDLAIVLEGVQAGGCRNLRFVAERASTYRLDPKRSQHYLFGCS